MATSGKLAKSLFIHSHLLATTIQHKLQIEYGIPIPSQLSDWAYYRNALGLAHDIQNVIQVTIPKTSTVINLTLATYTGILKYELEKKESLFENLLASYPEDVSYILGIMNPVDLLINNKSAYKEGEIVYYDSRYLNEAEDNIIPILQEYINNYQRRWLEPKYSITDIDYAIVYSIQLRVFTWYKIDSIRNNNTDTNNASGEEILNRLGDYGIRKYVDVLNISTRLWLYKNIKYISHNMGKDSIIDLLNENILLPNGYKLEEFNLKVNSPARSIDLEGPVNEYTDEMSTLVNRYDNTTSTSTLAVADSQHLNSDILSPSSDLTKYLLSGKSKLRTKLLQITNEKITLDKLFRVDHLLLDIAHKILIDSPLNTYQLSISPGSGYTQVSGETMLNVLQYVKHKMLNIPTTITSYEISYPTIFDGSLSGQLSTILTGTQSDELLQVVNLAIPDEPTSSNVSEYLTAYKDIEFKIYSFIISNYNAVLSADAELVYTLLHNTVKPVVALTDTLETIVTTDYVIDPADYAYIIEDMILTITEHSITEELKDDIAKLKSIMETFSSYTVKYSTVNTNTDYLLSRYTNTPLAGINSITLTDAQLDCTGVTPILEELSYTDATDVQVVRSSPISITRKRPINLVATSYIEDREIFTTVPRITVTTK